MEYSKDLLQKKMKTWLDIFWALIFLYLILYLLFDAAHFNREGIRLFQAFSGWVLIGWAILLQVLKRRYKNEINRQEQTEEKTDRL